MRHGTAGERHPAADEAAPTCFESHGSACALKAVRAWLAAPEAPWLLAVTGPAGSGRSEILAQARSGLTGDPAVTVVAGSATDGIAVRHLVERTHAAARARDGGAGLVVVLDDADLLAPADRAAFLALREGRPKLRAIVVTKSGAPGGFTEAMTVAVRPLAGPGGRRAEAAADPVLACEAARFLLHHVRRRDPVAEFSARDAADVGRICAASFGRPADLVVFAGLIDRHGLAAVGAALAEGLDDRYGRLAELLPDRGEVPPNLAADEMLVLASVLAAPGGASLAMLHQSLPRLDVVGIARRLIASGLVAGSVAGSAGGSDAGHPIPDRLHLRVTGLAAASWCAARPEVPFGAISRAQGDYLAARLPRLAADLCTPAQPAVLAEFRHERRNLWPVLTELLESGQGARAVSLMADAVPLFARSSGVAQLLPPLLRAIRVHAPQAGPQRLALDLLAVRVLLAAGEQDAASVCYERLIGRRADEDVPGPQRADLLGVLAAEHPKPGEVRQALAERVHADAEAGDLAGLCESASAYFSFLIGVGEYEGVVSECRPLLFEAMRAGDDFTTALMMLWRAAADGDGAVGGAGGGVGGGMGGGVGGVEGVVAVTVERTLVKLRPLGAEAVMAAIATVLDAPFNPTPRRSLMDQAAVLGALWSADWMWTAPQSGLPQVLPEAAARLLGRTDPETAARWFETGRGHAAADVVARALTCDPTGAGHSGDLAGPAAPEPAGERVCDLDSPLTRRESEVAGLVAAGLTNKQIARRLGISVWTVTNHLRQVMRKIDCSTRVQVATWVRAAQAA